MGMPASLVYTAEVSVHTVRCKCGARMCLVRYCVCWTVELKEHRVSTDHARTTHFGRGPVDGVICQILLRKGFRDTNNLITDTFLKHWRNLKNTVVSKTLIPGLYFDDFKLWTVIHTVEYRLF